MRNYDAFDVPPSLDEIRELFAPSIAATIAAIIGAAPCGARTLSDCWHHPDQPSPRPVRVPEVFPDAGWRLIRRNRYSYGPPPMYHYVLKLPPPGMWHGGIRSACGQTYGLDLADVLTMRPLTVGAVITGFVCGNCRRSHPGLDPLDSTAQPPQGANP